MHFCNIILILAVVSNIGECVEAVDDLYGSTCSCDALATSGCCIKRKLSDGQVARPLSCKPTINEIRDTLVHNYEGIKTWIANNAGMTLRNCLKNHLSDPDHPLICQQSNGECLSRDDTVKLYRIGITDFIEAMNGWKLNKIKACIAGHLAEECSCRNQANSHIVGIEVFKWWINTFGGSGYYTDCPCW